MQYAAPRKVTCYPSIENMHQFKHCLHLTLTKFADTNMVEKAHEEMKDLMTEHITNTDRMNVFLTALASDTKYNVNQRQKKEVVKLFSVAAEVFEDSLQTFIPKIVTLLNKLLQNQKDYLHFSVQQVVGSVVKYIINGIPDQELVL